MIRWIRSSIPRLDSVVAIFLVMLAAGSLRAAEDVWLPIPPEDLALQDNPASPGSSAMILFKEDFRDDKKKVRQFYYRIKIFNDEGREHANIEIPYDRRTQEVKDIAARTIQPDGRIIEFRGAVYEKTLMRARKLRILAKTFTLPEVVPGSIIEYRYQIKNKKDPTLDSVWVVQEPLFIREARLTLSPVQGRFFHLLGRLLPSGSEFQEEEKGKEKVYQATLRDIPAFETEAFMPPPWQLQMRYHVIYRSPTSEWIKIADSNPMLRGAGVVAASTLISPEQAALIGMAKFVEDFIGNPKTFRKFVQPIISADDQPEGKLHKLYAAVQERIRNLSYEEQYTKQERKQERLKERKSAKDVWNYRYGSAEEITMLFVGLCRTAGFVADIVFVSQRDTHFFDNEIPAFAQFDGLIVAVDLPKGPRYLDPGTRFAPFGQLSWENQGVEGMRVLMDPLKERGRITNLRQFQKRITIPPPLAEENVSRRQITVELQPGGAALVRAVTQHRGQRAIERKNEFFDLSSDQRERQLREELEELFPSAKVTEIAWKGLDGADELVEISCTFEIPDSAIAMGSRLLIRPSLFANRSPFPQWKRTHSVYFPYPYNSIDEIKIVLPPGFELEHLPALSTQVPPFGVYEVKVSNEGTSVLYRKKVIVQDIIYRDSKTYLELKRFFDAIQAGDRLHLVFHQQ